MVKMKNVKKKKDTIWKSVQQLCLLYVLLKGV